MRRIDQRLQRGDREFGRAEERDPQRAACSPFPGALQLLDLPDDDVALDAAQAIDEDPAVEVIHFVLECPGEQAGALQRLRVAMPIESA